MRSFFILISFLTLITFSFTQAGCEKDNEVITNNVVTDTCISSNAIEGLWVGTYTVSGGPQFGNQFMALSIKSGSKMTAETEWTNIQHFSTGSWNLTGNSFSSSFTAVYGMPSHLGIVENITATKTDSTLVGTWANVAPQTGSGTITLRRMQ